MAWQRRGQALLAALRFRVVLRPDGGCSAACGAEGGDASMRLHPLWAPFAAREPKAPPGSALSSFLQSVGLPTLFTFRSFAVGPPRGRRRPTNRPSALPLPAKNEDIPFSELRVVFPDEENRATSVLSLSNALEEAKSRNLDLVVVSRNANPPVARLAPYEKVVYTLRQKEKAAVKAARESQRLAAPKEVRVGCHIAEHDLQVKLDSARRFLQDGHSVRLVVRFRGGREIAPARNLLGHALKMLDDVAEVRDPRQVDRPQMNQWVVNLASKKTISK